jgi:hypothetical protein
VTLLLTNVSLTSVEFRLLDEHGGFVRPVVAYVGSGHSALDAICFPSSQSEASASLGDAARDRRVRQRAAEELVRHAAAVRDATEGRRVA